MLRRWICLRRLRPSTFTCLCLFLSSSLLTFTIMLHTITTTGRYQLDRGLRFSARLRHALSENREHEGARKSASNYQHQDATFINNDFNQFKDNDELRPPPYNPNLQNIITDEYFSLQRSDYNVSNKQYSRNGLQNDKDYNSSSTSNAEQSLLVLLRILSSHKLYIQTEIIRNILQYVNESKLDIESFTNVTSDSISQDERVSLIHAFVKLKNNTMLDTKQKLQLVSLLKQIIDSERKSKSLSQYTFGAGQLSSRDQNIHKETTNLTNIKPLYSDRRLNSSLNLDNFNGSEQTESTSSSNFSMARPCTASRILDIQQFHKNETKCRGSSCIVNGIYWSQAVEDKIPKGLSNEAADEWISKARKMDLKSLQSASWYKCGRAKNALASFMDGSEACVRYRAPNDRLVQGEVMSYWLARFLNLDNVPPVFLISVDTDQWSGLQNRFLDLGWEKGNYAAIIMWIDEIDSKLGTQVVMPPVMLKAYREKHSLDGKTLTTLKLQKATNRTKSTRKHKDNLRQVLNDEYTAASLAQWGSLVIFDYLTGNYDRIASMQDGAENENRSSILEEPIRNLRKSNTRDKLWFIDNESGFLDAYDLMYRGTEHGRRFIKFHKDMLHSLCVFQRRIVDRLSTLHKQRRAHKFLEKLAEKHEPLFQHIERDSSYELFARYFHRRLEDVVKWINHCENIAKDESKS